MSLSPTQVSDLNRRTVASKLDASNASSVSALPPFFKAGLPKDQLQLAPINELVLLKNTFADKVELGKLGARLVFGKGWYVHKSADRDAFKKWWPKTLSEQLLLSAPKEERVYLNVTYEQDRVAVSRLGALYLHGTGWYVHKSADRDAFKKWWPTTSSEQLNSAQKSLSEQMNSALFNNSNVNRSDARYAHDRPRGCDVMLFTLLFCCVVMTATMPPPPPSPPPPAT